MTQLLLEIRKRMKERKPEFIRQDTQKRRKLSIKWKKPKGLHSKIRHKFKGHSKMPSPGYKSPIKVKGLHASGLKQVIVFSPEDVKNINKQSEGIIISKSVGIRKMLEVLKKAKELNIQVLNLNMDDKIRKIEDFVNSKKKKQKDAKKEKIQEKKESNKIEESKAKSSEEASDEQKKKTEKKEKDKILTKRV